MRTAYCAKFATYKKVLLWLIVAYAVFMSLVPCSCGQCGILFLALAIIASSLILLGALERIYIFLSFVLLFVVFPSDGAFIFFAWFLFSFVSLFCTVPTKYILCNNMLVIQHGLLFRMIAYKRIEKVYRKESFLYPKDSPRSPVRIEYKKKFFALRKQPYVDIYPDDADSFIKSLKSKTPE